jgi:Lrp/AsnC family transcriptional regulator, leucine-responsive regulatory protein
VRKTPLPRAENSLKVQRSRSIPSRAPVALDDFDRRLLNALQQDSRRTGEQLAALVGLSPAACLRRAQRLRETGIIEREIAIVAPAAVGRALSMVLAVTLDSEQLDVVTEFKRRIRNAPEVEQCYSVTGPTDFILIIRTAGMDDYQDFIRRCLLAKYVKRFEAMVVIDRVKFDTAVPTAGSEPA